MKILIRFESYALWWLETRIKNFKNFFIKNNKYQINILTNKSYNNYFWKKILINNHFNFFSILKDIFTFRNYNIIETQWLRDPIIAIINYLLYFIFYKVKKIKLIIVFHWVLWWNRLNILQKIIYKILLLIWTIISRKIIVVSRETKIFYIKKFFIFKLFKNKVEIIKNYINFDWLSLNNFKINKNKKIIILSRIDIFKSNWIKKVINFSKKYNLKINIYWDWKNLNNLRKYENNDIKFKWEKKISEINFNDYFIIFWMWRALLDWLSKWLIPILISYDDILTELNISNYELIKKTNFSWRWINKKNKKDIKNIIDNYDEKKLSELIKLVKNDISIKNLKNYYK